MLIIVIAQQSKIERIQEKGNAKNHFQSWSWAGYGSWSVSYIYSSGCVGGVTEVGWAGLGSGWGGVAEAQRLDHPSMEE